MSEPIKLASQRGAAPECAEILRDMAGQAERGEVISVTVMYERPDGTIGNWQSGTTSRIRMAGHCWMQPFVGWVTRSWIDG